MLSLPPFHRGSRQQDVRLHELDGIRGWAALSVVLFHLFWETFGAKIPWFRNPLTGFLFDGNLAVSVFFVLSGEALSSSYFAGKGDRAIWNLAIKRYPRLTIPILFTCIIVYFLMSAHLTSNIGAGLIVGRSDWLGSWLQFSPSFARVLKYSFFDVYRSVPSQPLDPFLWTMNAELKGSLFVFAAILTLRHTPFPRAVLLIVALTFLAKPISSFTQQLPCFIAGIIFADLRWAGMFRTLQQKQVMRVLCPIALVSIAVTDGLINARDYALLFNYKPFLAIMLTGFIFADARISAFFASPFSALLGRLSFPVYLMQFPVIVSLTSHMIIWFSRGGVVSSVEAIAISTASFVAILIVAAAFEPVEIITREFGNYLVRLSSPVLVIAERIRIPIFADSSRPRD
jgi:peptidoglycan/LPS O-acetylase OafA/YrhL